MRNIGVRRLVLMESSHFNSGANKKMAPVRSVVSEGIIYEEQPTDAMSSISWSLDELGEGGLQ